MVPIIPEPAISIHAPSRERRTTFISTFYKLQFQSTLPRGSDKHSIREICNYLYFNPRSLAGATEVDHNFDGAGWISIHAPSRERRLWIQLAHHERNFNPRSLAGATCLYQFGHFCWGYISIHAPSRERLCCDSFNL